jgi:hypothetical protein
MSQKRDHTGKSKSIGGTSSCTRTSNVTTSSAELGQRLERNGVVHKQSEALPPADADDIRQLLDRSRESTPAEEDFAKYQELVETANNEDARLQAFQKLAKLQVDRPPVPKGRLRYLTGFNTSWTEVKSHVRNGISDPKPDVWEAYETTAYPSEALEALQGVIAPARAGPAMGCLVVHAKGPQGSLDQAIWQCAYDGSVMADAAIQAHKFCFSKSESNTEFLKKTKALTVAFSSGYVHIYSSHFSQGKHHHHLLTDDAPGRSMANFRTTRRRVRNAQDWAQSQAKQLLADLWRRTKEMTQREQVRDSTEMIPENDQGEVLQQSQTMPTILDSASGVMLPPTSARPRASKRRRKGATGENSRSLERGNAS